MKLFSQDEEDVKYGTIPGTGIEDYPDVSDATLYKAASRTWRSTADGKENRALKQDNSFLAASYGQEVADSVSVLNYFKEQADGDVELAQFIKDFQYGDTDDSIVLQHLRDIYDPEEKIPFSEKAFAGAKSAVGTMASTVAKVPAVLALSRYFDTVDFGISEDDEDVSRAGKILEAVIKLVPESRQVVAGLRIAGDIRLTVANLLQKKPEDASQIYTTDARGIADMALTGGLEELRAAQGKLDWGASGFYGGAKAEQFLESAKQFRQILKPPDIRGVDSDLFWYEYIDKISTSAEEIKEFYTKDIRPEVAELFSVQLADTMGQYAAYAAAGWASPAVMLGSLYIEGHDSASRAILKKYPDADAAEIAEMVNAQALTYTAFAYPMEKLAFDKFMKYGPQRAILGKGLKGGTRAAMLNARDEIWRRGIGGITEGATEAMQEVLGGVLTQRMPTAGELLDITLLSTTSSFIWGIGTGAMQSRTKITHAEDIAKRYGVSQDEAYQIQKRYEDSSSVAERLETGKELLREHGPAVARYEAARRTEAISLNKFGYRVGADGKPLGPKEFEDINKSGKTDLEIAEMLPKGFEHTELFVEAVRGNKDAQTQYNKEIVGKGKGPSILFQSAGDAREISFQPNQDAELDVDIAESIAELPWDEVSDMVVLSQSAGIELSNELRTAIKIKLEASGMNSSMLRRQIQIKLNNVASEVAVEKERKSLDEYLKVEVVSGKALSRAERGYSILNDGFSFLHNYRKNTPDSFFEEIAGQKAEDYGTKPTDEVRHLRLSNLRGIQKLKSIFYPLVQTGDIHTVSQALGDHGFKPEGIFSRKVMAATYQFSLMKKEQRDGNGWSKDPVIAPKVQEIGKIFNINLNQAADVYAIWEAVGLPIDKILMRRDTSPEAAAQIVEGELTQAPSAEQAPVEQTAEQDALYQQKKGSVQFMQDGTALVTAFESSDVSTALHEAAHVVRRWMFDPDADESIRASDRDIQTTYGYYGVQDTWTREQEEAFANDFVNWIQSGRSPDAKLDGTFKRLSSWLTKIYGKLVNKTSPEMSQVFDNLIVREHMTAESAEVGQNRYGKEEQYIRTEAQTRANEMFTRLGLDSLKFSESEKAAVMQYVAQKQGYITEEDALPPINLADLPKSADLLLKTWNRIAKELEAEIRVIANATGRDFQSIRDDYFPLRHSFDNDTADTDVFEAAGERITAHRRGQFDGVVKDPVAQLTAYVNDVMTYIELGQSILRERETVIDNMPEIAEAWKKNEENREAEEEGEAPKHELTPAEMEALEKLRTLQALEAVGEGNSIQIKRSALTSPVFMEAVIRSATMRKQTDLLEDATIQQTAAHNVKEMLKNFADPASVAAYKDGVSYDSMRETGKFMGGNTYILRNTIYKNDANLKESILVAQESIRTAVNIYVKNGGSHKVIDSELATIFQSRGATRELMQSVNNLNQIRALFNVDSNTAELLNQVAKTLNDVEAAGQTPFTVNIQTDTGQISANQSKEMGLLLRKQEEGKLTEKETKRLDYLYMQKNGRNKFVRWVLEKTALDKKKGLIYLDNLIQRTYRNTYIGESIAFLESWETYLKSQGQDETADYWRNYRQRNLEGKMYDAENRILDFYGKSAKKGTDFALKFFGKESSATAEDIKLNAINALNHLHRARINAWLTGNLAWSLTTQLSSLAMTVGSARGKNFLIAVRDSSKKGKSDPLNEYADKYAGSLVKKIKETASNEIGKVVAMSEFQDNKIEQTWREVVRNKANEFSGRVEDKTVKISYLAGKMRGEELGLRGEEAEAFGDYIAATTQSMYDQYTRNPALQSHLFRAAAPMQSYVFTAYSQVLSTLGQSGVERSGKDRAIEFLEWKMAAKLWSFFWSMVFGDDIAKAIFNPAKKMDTLGSHLPLLGESMQRFKDKKQNEFAEWVGADFLVVDNYEFPGNLSQFISGTQKAFGPDTDRRLRETSRWSVKYITPFVGIPGSRIMDNFSRMVDAYRTDGYVYDYLGEKKYDEIPWLSEDPLKAATAMAWGSIMGIQAVNEREAAKK